MKRAWHYAGIFLAMLAWTSCKDLSTDAIGGNAGSYDAMVIERQGGGDLGFTVLPNANSSSYTAVIQHREFKDTLILISIAADEIDASSFGALTNALAGKYEIAGDFKQTTLPAGSWVRVYLVHEGNKEEVTNIQLRDLLLKFEETVREKLKMAPDPSTDPTQGGRYQYASYDSSGILVVHGWFKLTFVNSESVSGEWHFAPVGNPRDIGPQTGDGTLAGGFHDGKLWIDLNPQFRDNNLLLSGTLDGNRYSGEWAWISFVGITSTGTFEAVKQ